MAVALQNPKGILFHWYNPNSHKNPVFSLSFFRSGTCQKAEPKSNVGFKLGITKLREALVYSRNWVRIFYCHRIQVAKVATKPKLPPFFFATFRSPLGKLPTYVASFVLRLLCGERRLPQVRFRVRRSYSNRYLPYVLKIHLRSDSKRPAVIRNLSHLFPFLMFYLWQNRFVRF